MKADFRAGMLTALLAGSLCVFTGCGKGNLFSWAHNAGSGSDPKSLASDAYAALVNKEYAKALEYYNKLLEIDPKSAETIYGYASAELANSGLDIASLVSNLVKQQPSSPCQARNLSEAIYASAGMQVAPPNPGTNILPSTILSNIAAIRNAINNVLSANRLPLIVNGGADGSLAPDDPNVNINLAFCYILHAALLLDEYVVLDTDFASTVVNSSIPNVNDWNTAANDLYNAYNCLLTAVNKLNLASDATIRQVMNDAKQLYNDYHDDASVYGTITVPKIN